MAGHVGLRVRQDIYDPHAEGRRQSESTSLKSPEGLTDQINSPLDLTVPQSPADPLNRLDEASTASSVCLARAGPAPNRLGDVLIPHGQMEPV